MTEENIYVKHFRKRLMTKLAEEFNTLEKGRDAEDFSTYDDPSFHVGWYDARIETMRIIMNMVRESK